MQKIVLEVNTVNTGSTGTIMHGIGNYLTNNQYQVYYCTRDGVIDDKGNTILRFKTKGLSYQIIRFNTKFYGNDGFISNNNTKLLINFINKINPDIIHIHNVHGHYINIIPIINYVSNHQCKIIWTLHDCWPMTGKCPYYGKCHAWEECQCNTRCPCSINYPRSLFVKNFHKYFVMKQKLFYIVKNKISFVLPSIWLNDLFEKSYLKDYEHIIINNGIDIKKFPFKEKIKENGKIKIIGVANPWNKNKGLDYFKQLSNSLDPNKFDITIIGSKKKKIKNAPNLHCLPSLPNAILSKHYQEADLLLNCSLYENYPTIIMEAISSGTPVVSFDTGGSKEMIKDNINGKMIQQGNFVKLFSYINVYKRNQLKVIISDSASFSIEHCAQKYLNLFNKLK